MVAEDALSYLDKAIMEDSIAKLLGHKVNLIPKKDFKNYKQNMQVSLGYVPSDLELYKFAYDNQGLFEKEGPSISLEDAKDFINYIEGRRETTTAKDILGK